MKDDKERFVVLTHVGLHWFKRDPKREEIFGSEEVN